MAVDGLTVEPLQPKIVLGGLLAIFAQVYLWGNVFVTLFKPNRSPNPAPGAAIPSVAPEKGTSATREEVPAAQPPLVLFGAGGAVGEARSANTNEVGDWKMVNKEDNTSERKNACCSFRIIFAMARTHVVIQLHSTCHSTLGSKLYVPRGALTAAVQLLDLIMTVQVDDEDMAQLLEAFKELGGDMADLYGDTGAASSDVDSEATRATSPPEPPAPTLEGAATCSEQEDWWTWFLRAWCSCGARSKSNF
eukprot:s4309_g4.t1